MCGTRCDTMIFGYDQAARVHLTGATEPSFQPGTSVKAIGKAGKGWRRWTIKAFICGAQQTSKPSERPCCSPSPKRVCPGTVSGVHSVGESRSTVHRKPCIGRLGKVLHGRLQQSKIRRRGGLKGLQPYIRPLCAGFNQRDSRRFTARTKKRSRTHQLSREILDNYVNKIGQTLYIERK